MKLCKTCGQLKDESEFRINNGKPGPYCKECYAEHKRESKPFIRERPECKCLTCPSATRTTMDELKVLYCGDEACFMNCSECNYRPASYLWCKERKAKTA